MKKLSKEQLDGLPLLKKGRYTRLHKILATLLPGEGLHIEKGKDWAAKRGPYEVINRFAKKNNWKIETGRSPQEDGWIAKRLS